LRRRRRNERDAGKKAEENQGRCCIWATGERSMRELLFPQDNVELRYFNAVEAWG
jgi:hypothetical protein